MNMKIVADSSANIFVLEGVAFASVPLKIQTGRGEYVDDASVDLDALLQDLRTTKVRTQTSCPNAFEWQSAFGDADCVFAVTITSNLSGSYAAACKAREDALAENPARKIAVIDSLSTGPEMLLLIERIRAGILAGKGFEEIESDVREYAKQTRLIFGLQSLKNLARNGRVNPLVAKLAGLLGIQVVGMASAQGTLQPLCKPRGNTKALQAIFDEMKKLGFVGGRVRIAHCNNPEKAQALKWLIQSNCPDAEILVDKTTALCSYYAEEGGLLVGFEG
ncbi:MAG: DegV family protein [Clostridia bacterium]|nr:DegV family protein [Clostridia bacterium]